MKPDIEEINKMFYFHARHIWGIEFDLSDYPNDSEELGLRLKELKLNTEYLIDIDSLFIKYKDWKFENEKSLGYSKHDYDWHEFTIEIIDPSGIKYIGKGESCPAEPSTLNEIIDSEQERLLDYQMFIKLKKKWNFE